MHAEGGGQEDDAGVRTEVGEGFLRSRSASCTMHTRLCGRGGEGVDLMGKGSVITDLAQEEGPLDVDAHALLVVRLGGVLERLVGQDPRVGDQDVDAAEPVDGLLDEALDVRQLAGIAFDRQHLVLAQLRHDGLGRGAVRAVGQDHVGALRYERGGHGGADALGAAGYEGGLVLEGHGGCCALLLDGVGLSGRTSCVKALRIRNVLYLYVVSCCLVTINVGKQNGSAAIIYKYKHTVAPLSRLSILFASLSQSQHHGLTGLRSRSPGLFPLCVLADQVR